MVRKHTVHTRDDRYRVPSYERGAGSRVAPSSGDFRGSRDLWDRGGESTEFTSEERRALEERFPSAFAIREGTPSSWSYPVPTVRQLRAIGASRPEVSAQRHALNALQRVAQHGTPEEVRAVHALVRRRQPELYGRWKRNDPVLIAERNFNNREKADKEAAQLREMDFRVKIKPTLGERAKGLFGRGSEE